MLRSFIGLFLLGTSALLAPLARAQTSVYVIGGLANYGIANLDSNSFSYKGDTGDIGGGVFYNFPIQSRVTVGIDARAEGSPGYKGGLTAGAAFRVGFVPHRNPLRPWFQIGGGVVRSNYNEQLALPLYDTDPTPTTSNTVTNSAAEFTFGLDIRLTDRLDLRAPEIGAEAGGGNGVHAAASYLNVGLVYHLHPKAHP